MSIVFPSGSRVRNLLTVGGAVSLLLGAATPVLGQDAATPTAGGAGTGAVYAMTNNPLRNEVIAYARAVDGSLSLAGRYDTGGKGSGTFENSDTALVVASAEGESSPVDLGGGNDFVFAVNAGSDSISVFRVTDGGLKLAEVQETGGERPTSLTVRNGHLYVLNSAGDAGGASLCFGGHPQITGFTVADSGTLEPIPDSTRELSGGPQSGCAQVSFTPSGNVLVVSQITQDTITTFPIDNNGVPGKAIDNKPTGSGPFGYTFDGQGRLLVTENSQAVPGKATVASYTVGDDGKLVPIGDSLATGETDPCWILVTPDGKYAYVVNFGPNPILRVASEDVRRGTISSFRVGDDGTLDLIDAQAAQAGVGAADIAFGGDGRYLYVMNTIEGSVSGFRIGDDGGLTLVTSVGGLPTNPFGEFSIGLAARDNG